MTGELRPDGDRCAVRFERLYDFTPAELWSALTDPERLRRWLAKADVRPGEGGSITLEFEEDGTVEGGRVLEWDEPRVLECEWRHVDEQSVVRFELHPQEAGTLLVLDHRRLPRSEGAGHGAGWHAHLDALAGEVARGRVQRRSQELLPVYRAQADELGWARPGASPVREALYAGDRDAAEAAAAGADLDVFDAAALGRVDRLRELLDADATLPHELSDDGFTPLHLAASPARSRR